MDVGLQAKLLRALQERRIRPVGGVEEVETDVRIIAACNADLPRYVEEEIPHRPVLPPQHLPHPHPAAAGAERGHPFSLPQPAGRAVPQAQATPGADARGPERLLAHNWPGNVRELRNVLEFCAYLTPSGVITELSLPENLRTGPTAQPPLTLAQRTRTFERAEILRLLAYNGSHLEGKKKPPHNSVSRWPRFTTSWRHLTIHSFPKLTSKNLEVYFTF
ncbi:sigma 54-interacting transcriptional regulator [Flavonifractor plautii]|nr:sigma 54-interacting transcriptional regulator [Flavonifractor plautii]